MARKKNNVVNNTNTESPETFSLIEGTTVSENNTATVEATETPATPVKGKAKKNAAPKLSDFKVLQTIEVHPSQVELVEKFRGRAKLASEDTVKELAESMRTRGQQQAIQVREKEGEPGKYECVFGNTRALAANALVNGYTNAAGKEIPAHADFRLRCEVVKCDDETAFAANVVENAQRKEVSPIGNALNQKMLKEEYGMSGVAIAAMYGYASSATVTRLAKLLELEEEYQNAVEDGLLTQGAAFLLADVPAGDARKAVWLAVVAACEGEDNIGSTPMVAAIKAWRKAEREAKEGTGTGTATDGTPAGETGTATDGTPAGETGTATATDGTPAAPKKYARTIKEFKDTVSAIAADEACPARVKEAMGVITGFLAGDVEEMDFAKWFAANLS